MWFLEGVDLYTILCPHRVKEYAGHNFTQFEKGDFIYFKDDQASNIFMVSKGKVKLVYYTEEGNEVVKAVLRKGEIFGEMAILGEEHRNDCAVAVSSNTKVCPLNVETMYDLMRKNLNFRLHIYKIIGHRVKRLERRLELLFFKDTRTRLVDFLHDLGQEYGEKMDGGEVFIENHYTQKDMADLIGARRETVSTLLNDLKEEGLIDYNRRSIVIKQPQQLAREVFYSA